VTLALVGLLAVSVAWGSSFPLTKSVLERMSAMNFLALRYTMAAVVMLVLFWPAVRRLGRTALWRGTVLGGLYALGQIVQNIGLERTPASVSGFVTGMYVVLTPLCAAVLLRTRIGPRVWSGAVLAAVGLATIALNGLSIGVGEGLTLFSALIYALHIVGLGTWSTSKNALGLAVVQIAVVALVVLVVAIIVEPAGVTLPTTGFDWTAIIYMAVIPGAAAMIVQSWAQAHLAPSRAAIIMSTEPVWAAGLSIAFLGEPLTWRVLLGGGLMLAAMLIVETGPRLPKDAPRPEELPKWGA